MQAALKGSDPATPQLSYTPETKSPKRTLRLRWEQWHPAVISLGVIIFAWHSKGVWLLNASWGDKLLDRTINVCAIVAAYLLTAATILPALGDKQTMKWLSAWGYHQILIGYLQNAIYGCGALLLLSCFGSAMTSWFKSPHLDQFYSAVWWGLLGYAILSMLRATNLLIRILKSK